MTEIDKRTAILILGAHRSGTSALTRMISLLGYELPQNLMKSLDGNEAGHWESEALAQMNDSIFEELNLAWYEWHPYRLDQIGSKRKETIVNDLKSVLLNEYPGNDDIVIKDPRVCRLTEFVVPAIQMMPAELKVIIPFRNPLEVMASLEKRNGLSKPQGALIWLRYVLDAEFGSRGLDRAFIPYEDYLNAPQKSMSALCKQLKLKPKNSAIKVKKQLQGFVRPDLKHHDYDPGLLMMEPTTRGWVSDTVKNLLSLTDDPTNKEAREALDAIRLQFGQVTPILKASLDALYINQEAKVTERDTKISQKNDEIETLQESLEAFQNSVPTLEQTVSERTNQLQERDETIKTLEASLESLKNNIPTLEQTVSERTNQLQERDETIKTLEVNLEAQRISKEQAEGELSQLAGTLEHRNKEIAEKSAEFEIKISKFEAETTEKQIQFETHIAEKEKQLHDERNELSGQITALKEESRQQNERHDTLSKEHALLLEEYERLAQERSTLRETIGRIDAEKKKHQEDYQKLSSEYDALIETRDSLLKNNENFETQLRTISQERSELSARLEKANKEHNSLTEQLKHNQENYDSLSQKHSESLTRHQSEITSIVQTKEHLDRQVQDVRERLKQEQRTVIKPLFRRIRGAGGTILRIFLPNRWVNRLALVAPTAEQKMLIEQQKTKALSHHSEIKPNH